MEIGDTLFLILMVVFIVFGFFKELNKKKNIDESTPSLNEELKDVFKEMLSQPDTSQVPPPVSNSVKSKKVAKKLPEYAFQSSMSLVADFEGESSLSHYKLPDYEMDSPIEKDIFQKVHPVIEDLTGDNYQTEIQKAILYSEILKRKY